MCVITYNALCYFFVSVYYFDYEMVELLFSWPGRVGVNVAHKHSELSL